ncbi:hypothetical protein Btru_034176, partial [Bulinus truncatus]
MAALEVGVTTAGPVFEERSLVLGSPDVSESLEEIDIKEAEDAAEDEDISIEMLSAPNSDAPSPIDPEEQRLAGWLKLVNVGFRKTVKHVWFVYGEDTGKLYYYRQPQDLLPLGEIDLRTSSLSYDASNSDKPGLFEIRCDNKVFQIDAQDRVHMLYWLDALQKKRRLFSLRQSNLAQDIFMGKKKQLDASGLLGGNVSDVGDELYHSGSNPNVENVQQYSLLDLQKEIRNAVSSICLSGSNTSLNRASAALSEDWSLIDEPPSGTHQMPTDNNSKSDTKWHLNSPTGKPEENSQESGLSLPAQTIILENYMKPSAESNVNNNTATSLSVQHKSVKPQTTNPGSGTNGRSNKFMSALRSNFKIMKETVKERNQRQNSLNKQQSSGPQSCYKCIVLSEDLANIKEYLKSTEEELQANNEIIKLLQKELAVMTTEMNTRKECAGKDEYGLQQALKQKDKHIVELEYSRTALLEERSTLKQENRMQENELKDLKDQISMFQQTIAVKDEIIVSLTNQNQELRNNPGNYSSQDGASPLGGFSIDPVSLAAERKEQERLTDSCKAYEVQNEFLTKEILALNELRQHDETRQKILKMNIAKLEAQYYQTRSKYLYLLNEKHVPVR